MEGKWYLLLEGQNEKRKMDKIYQEKKNKKKYFLMSEKKG